MTNKFFSNGLSWRRVWLVSSIATLALLLAGFLLWYLFLYLPMAQRLSESRRADEELRQIYEAKGLPLDSLPIQGE